jgi:hypothetical protein
MISFYFICRLNNALIDDTYSYFAPTKRENFAEASKLPKIDHREKL